MLFNVMLLSIVMFCVATDLYNRKIYNAVIFPALLATFILHYILGGWIAVGQATLGFFVGFGILLVPYLLGGMGAGDVKLLALVGAMKGTSFVLTTAIYMALLGAVIALVVLLCRKGMVKRLIAFFYFMYGLRYGIKIPLGLNKGALSAAYPYGLAIAGGTILCFIVKGWGLL